MLFDVFIKKKKQNPSFGSSKKLKSYATNAPLSIFSLGKGRETLMPQNLLKSFKVLHSALSDQKPLQCTSLDLQCVCDTLQKLSICSKLHVHSPQISHFSSNRREQNSAPPFQFVTPGRELIQKSTKSMNFRHFHTQKVTNFLDNTIIRNLRPENLQKSTQKDTNFGRCTH